MGMKILVCVKQVPDLERIVVKSGAHGIATLYPFSRFDMNRFDEFAVEQAVHIKESLKGVHIDAITVGPEKASQVLKRAMGMGSDEGIHLLTATDTDPGPEAVAAWIAEFAYTGEYDLVLCGSMSEDQMNGQVGPMAAARMDLPYATQVMGMTLDRDLKDVTIEREIEGGARELVRLTLPALLALQPGINRPRYPSLSNLLRANQKVFKTIPTEGLVRVMAKVHCMGFRLPTRVRASQVIEGSAPEKAAKLAALLKAKALI